ncbi:MAG: ATP-binding cassette domain-containing protein [Armatimonadia bacterium]|nr:ATP-binding cassette domain-containing protein [Armatimonadia bacterium]
MTVFLRMVKESLRHWQLLLVVLALSIAAQAGMIAIPAIVRRMIDQVFDEGRTELLPLLSIGVVGLALAKAALQYAEMVNGGRFGQNVMRDMRRTVYHKLTRLSFGYFDRTRTGELMSRITNDMEPIGFFLMFYSRLIVRSTLLFLGTFIYCLTMNWKLALASLGTLPLLTITATICGAYIRPAFEKARAVLAEVTSRLQESIGAITIVKTYCREEREIERFFGDSKRLRDANYKAEKIDALYFPLTGFWAALAGVIVVWYGGVLTIRGEMSSGEFIAFNMYVAFLIMPMRMMGWGVSNAMRSLAAAERIYAVQDETPDLESPPDPKPVERLKGDIELRNVSFSYKHGEPVLRDIDLNIRTGETLGVLGTVASGKSTLTALIPRYYDPDAGQILIDGEDVRELNLEQLRAQIGMVFQESFLFSGTIRENIAFGRVDATEEEIRKAADDAAILEFIDSLEDGMDTQVGERGMRLSGGQQQRLAIARALLTDPRVLILDSCTSSVDTYTEYLIQQALENVRADRTTIIIAHRASSVAMADRVIVMDGGRIVQEGTPEELSADEDGLFARFDRLQQDLEGLEVA